MAGAKDKVFKELTVADPREFQDPGQREKEPAKNDPEKEKEGKRYENKGEDDYSDSEEEEVPHFPWVYNLTKEKRVDNNLRRVGRQSGEPVGAALVNGPLYRINGHLIDNCVSEEDREQIEKKKLKPANAKKEEKHLWGHTLAEDSRKINRTLQNHWKDTVCCVIFGTAKGPSTLAFFASVSPSAMAPPPNCFLCAITYVIARE
jgi:hypothetical protein